MNMKQFRQLLVMARKQGLKFESINPSGTGAYGFAYSATLQLEVDGNTITLSDQWCGGNIEGFCYRAHITCGDFFCRVTRLDGVSRRLLELIPEKSDAEIAAELGVSETDSATSK